MSDRPTRSFKLPSGAEIVLNSYLTGAELIELESIQMGSKLDFQIEEQQNKKQRVSFDPGAVYKARLQKYIELAIVSFNGNTEKPFIWNAIRGLRANEYKLVIAECDKTNAGLDAEEEKKTE